MNTLGVIRIKPGGTWGAIYADGLLPYFRRLGGGTTERASDVEPDGAGWSAYIRPWVSGGAVTLGPFPTREKALAAEVVYLRARGL